MLTMRTLLHRDGLQIADVACRHRRGRGEADEQTAGHALVFVRRGCFARTADGKQTLMDPTLSYFMSPGEDQRYDHPHEHGDDCTALFMTPNLLASLWGGELRLPSVPLPTSAAIDLEHRLLLRSAQAGIDEHELSERAIGLIARALERADTRRVASGRPSTLRARRALSDGVREILAANPERTLADLAWTLSVSPHHLSRVFRAQTGVTISRHRMRLRARGALERLAGGEADLARLAAELGFADQSHLCRVLAGETGQTPSALRRLLAGSRQSVCAQQPRT